MANHPVTLHCAGRTDAGVHATGQVVHFDAQFARPESAWVRGANAILPPTISICWSRQVSPDFHARFSATSRRYRYIFYNNKVKPAILSNLVTHHYRTLDEKAMHEAAQLLLGENDFTSFRGAACQSSTPMRNMMQLSVTRQGDFVIMEVPANAFLLHMVRNIAGVLQAIGAGMKPVEWAAEVLASKDQKAGRRYCSCRWSIPGESDLSRAFWITGICAWPGISALLKVTRKARLIGRWI